MVSGQLTNLCQFGFRQAADNSEMIDSIGSARFAAMNA
jgi:hypothetical protein